MDGIRIATRIKYSVFHQFIVFVIWVPSFQAVVAFNMSTDPSRVLLKPELAATPPSSVDFEPIEISPAVIPHYPIQGDSLPPMYPSVPTTYEPVLTGRCPVNFSAISSITEKTASDCSQGLAPIVGNVICCPQFSSFLHIFQGFYSTSSDKLVLQNAVAEDCFTDIISILASRGANSSISSLCSSKSFNLTGGTCPVRDVSTFENSVNTSKLLQACSTVDPLKECCRPICQPAIMEAAVKISTEKSFLRDNENTIGSPANLDTLNDCKGVVHSWISRKLSSEDANSAFRVLSSCKVNKACPLHFDPPSEVIKACRNVGVPNPTCCSSLNTYMSAIQKQMLITNRQAIMCATFFGSILQKGGVMTNVYDLCDVDLSDFSVRAYGRQGCLLRSLPEADVIYDNTTGYSFLCDLSNNIAAPWPSSSSVTSLSLCAPEMSLPALPTSDTLRNSGSRKGRSNLFIPILFLLVFSILF